MAQVKWTLQALDDLESICLFIACDAPQIAAVFADRAFRATNRLADYPRSGESSPDRSGQPGDKTPSEAKRREGSSRFILILFCHLANLKGNPDYLPSSLESPLFVRDYIIIGADSDLAQY